MAVATDGIQVISEFIEECIHKRKVDRTAEYWTADLQWYGTAFGDVTGRDAFEEILQEYLTGFSDLHLAIKDSFQVGDRVALRMLLSGTHDGKFYGLPATGRNMEVDAVAVFRVNNQKIAEEWFSADVYKLYRQLSGSPDLLLTFGDPA